MIMSKKFTFMQHRLLPFLIVAVMSMLLLATTACKKEVNSPKATCIEDMKGYRVAVLAGSTQDIEFTNNYPDLNIQRYNSVAEIFLTVGNNKADFAFIDSVCGIGANVSQYDIEVGFSTPLCGGPIAFPFRKNDTLKTLFDTFYTEIVADGTLNDIITRWTTGDIEAMETPADVKIYTEGTPLNVAVCASFPFEHIKNGKWTGLEIEILQRFAAKLQQPLVFFPYELPSIFPALNSHKVDLVAAELYVTEERLKQVDFSESYYYSASACWQRGDDAEVSGPSIAERFHNNFIVEDRWKMLVDGFWETIVIAIFSILLGSLLGAGVCWMRMHRNPVLQVIARVYIEILRDIPILVFLMIMYFVVFGNSTINATWVAVIAFSLNFAAYVSEMFRTAIEGVDRGQTEAGLAMGFSTHQTFFNFIVPQALKKVIPVFKGEAVSLVKNTSIVGYIAIQDLTKVSDIIRSRTFDAFFPLIVISIIYFLLAWLLGKLLDRLAK